MPINNIELSKHFKSYSALSTSTLNLSIVNYCTSIVSVFSTL